MGIGLKINRILAFPIVYKNWLNVAMNRFGLMPLKRLKLRNGIVFALKSNSVKNQSRARSIVSHTFSSEGYDIFKKIKRNDVVIDVGAFIGDFAIKAAKNEAIVYAFEPARETFDLLKKNRSLNGCEKNMEIFNKGIFTKKQIGQLHIHEWEGINSMIDCDWLNNNSDNVGFEKIDLVSVEDVFKKNKLTHCNFLKIDCEGVEAEIVMSIPTEILNKIEYIAMESTDYLKSGKNKQLLSFLRKRGFEVDVFNEILRQRVLDGDVVRIFARNKNFNKK